MSQKTKIEWTDTTWNPVRGCSRVSEGCRNCYAEKVAKRFSGTGQPYEGLIASGGQWNGNITLAHHLLGEPLKWKSPKKIFVNSMSDLFHENVPFEFIASVFAIMGVTTRHTYQILTKRPQRMREFFDWALMRQDSLGEWEKLEPTDFNADSRIFDHWPEDVEWRGYDNCGPLFPYTNVWLGVSVEDQKTANERIPWLLKTPAAVRWISAEPLLGAIDLNAITYEKDQHSECILDALFCEDHPDDCGPIGTATLDWVVVGGESGPGARPTHPDWVRSLRDQCVSAGTAFFFKQWGEWADVDNGPKDDSAYDGKPECWAHIEGGHHTGGMGVDFFNMHPMYRVGKKKAGRLLDGAEWSQFPRTAI